MPKKIPQEKENEIAKFVQEHPHEFTAAKLAIRFNIPRRTMYSLCERLELPVKKYENMWSEQRRGRVKAENESELFSWRQFAGGVL